MLVRCTTSGESNLGEYAELGTGPEGQDDYHWVYASCFGDLRDRSLGGSRLIRVSARSLRERSGTTPEPTVQDDAADNSDDSPADGI